MAETEVIITKDQFGRDVTIPIDENGNIILYRATDDPNRIIDSDFRPLAKDKGSVGLGQQSYFSPNPMYSHKYESSGRKNYKFLTEIKPNQILATDFPVNNYPELVKVLNIPEEYTNQNWRQLVNNDKAMIAMGYEAGGKRFFNDNIQTFKDNGIKAFGSVSTGTGGQPFIEYEIIPLVKEGDTLGIKPIATLQTKEGFAAGKSPEAFIETSLDTPTNVVDDLITKDVLSEAIEEAFDELEGLRLAGELPGNATHGLFTRELLNVLEAKGFDMDNPENIKRLDNWALNSGFSDVKSFSDLIIADVKEPTLVQSAFPGNNFDNDLNIIRYVEPFDTIFTESVNKNVIKNEIFNDRSSLDEKTIEYLKKNTDTPTNVVGAEVIDEGVDITESSAGVVDEIEGIQKETLEKLKNANDAFVDQQLDDIMARKINEVLPFVDTTINRADAIGIAITGPQVLDSADPVLNSFIKEIEQLTGENLQTSEKRKLREFIYDMARGQDNLLDDRKSFISNLQDGVDNSKLKDPGYKIWKNWQHSGAFTPKKIIGMTVNEFSAFGPPDYVRLLEGLEKSGENINYKAISDAGLDIPDTPTTFVGDEFVDNIVNANTQLVNDLPLSETVKNQFDNVVKNRAKNLATPGGVIDAVDVWEMGVLGLMITAIAYKEFDEIPTIFKRTAINMFNSMTSMYNIPPVPLEQYDLDYEFIEKVITTGEKVMPTDIIIKKVGEIAKGVGEKGLATGFGYVPTTPKNTDTMETTQKIQPGVQEEKMFEQLKPKKIKSAGGSGARIQ